MKTLHYFWLWKVLYSGFGLYFWLWKLFLYTDLLVLEVVHTVHSPNVLVIGSTLWVTLSQLRLLNTILVGATASIVAWYYFRKTLHFATSYDVNCWNTWKCGKTFDLRFTHHLLSALKFLSMNLLLQWTLAPYWVTAPLNLTGERTY